MQDLNLNFPIVDGRGNPTQYFIRFLQDRGIGQEEIIKMIEDLTALLANKADKSINLTAGVGLSGGGDLSADRTFNLEDTAVVPGAYTNTDLTVDAQGRIIAAANGSGGGGGGSWYFDPPTTTDFPILQLAGAGTVVDDADTGLIVYQPGSNVAPFNGVRKAIPVPASDWFAQMHIQITADNTNYSNRSLVLCDGAANKAVWWGWDNRQTAHYMHLLMGGAYDGYEVLRGMSAPCYWFRYDYITATGVLTCSVSGDGKQWIPVTTDNVKSYFGSDPSFIGLAVETSLASIGAAMSVDHYSDNM